MSGSRWVLDWRLVLGFKSESERNQCNLGGNPPWVALAGSDLVLGLGWCWVGTEEMEAIGGSHRISVGS
jgi:hypothetical protein